jgi:branched-chain amino acid transport system ATP-binding protein
MLEVRNITKRFGGLSAVSEVTTTIERGRIHAVIGPNGAGKTTFFNLISGTVPLTSGGIFFEKAREALDFVGLSHIANRMAGDISQEQRKRLAFALALATEPKLVLLDEPAGGVNPEETVGLAELIRKMVKHGLTVCLVEHKMDMIMSLADRITVLNYGEKIAEGTPAEIRANPAVIDAYLGSEHADV